MGRERPRVLVVDGDRHTTGIVRRYLERDGYTVMTAHDGGEGLRAALSDSPDVVVLALLLPGLSGLQVRRALKSESSVPIILTALATEQDKLTRLNLGADDYVTKPFSPRELAAKIRAVLRRTAGEGHDTGRSPLRYKQLTLLPGSHCVTIGCREVRLTPNEYRLLEVLMREPGRLFTRSQLVEKVLGHDFQGTDRTIDVHVLNLRRKIEAGPRRNRYIQTVYGGGYKLL